MANKLFVCQKLIPNTVCPYQISGEESWVVDQAVDHVVEEHEWIDSPQVRQDIENVLVDVNPDS